MVRLYVILLPVLGIWIQICVSRCSGIMSIMPPMTSSANSNACAEIKQSGGTPGVGTSSEFVKSLGATSDLSACVKKSIAWKNISSQAQRCNTACWFKNPSNSTFKEQCFCRADLNWLPTPTTQVDSARILWPCTSHSDCSYNGNCTAVGDVPRRCVCKHGWKGDRCELLDLLPVDKTKLGFFERTPNGTNVSTWGATMLWDEVSGMYHGWVSEMTLGCGINAWESNSQIVHVTSDTPTGPFKRMGVTWPVFAHEPDAVRGPEGEWVVMFSAYPMNATELAAVACRSCTNGFTPPPGTPRCPFQRGQPRQLGHQFRQMLATSSTPFGPWNVSEVAGLTVGWDWNTALAINTTDGSAVACLRAGFTWHAENYADNTTWHPVGTSTGGEGPGWEGASVEDPYLWIDEHGVYHALAHAFSPFFGVHAFSDSSGWPKNWTSGDPMAWNVTGVAYDNIVNFTDGTSVAVVRRERPHIIWQPGAHGRVALALTNGVQPYGRPNTPYQDHVFTLSQPLRTP
eukprot:m.21178 g.21178  ORF g.21178 m.21178 type:complete len:514 (+) comp12330_c0_seq1:69-1610(+)